MSYASCIKLILGFMTANINNDTLCSVKSLSRLAQWRSTAANSWPFVANN